MRNEPIEPLDTGEDMQFDISIDGDGRPIIDDTRGDARQSREIDNQRNQGKSGGYNNQGATESIPDNVS